MCYYQKPLVKSWYTKRIARYKLLDIARLNFRISTTFSLLHNGSQDAYPRNRSYKKILLES